MSHVHNLACAVSTECIEARAKELGLATSTVRGIWSDLRVFERFLLKLSSPPELREAA